MRSVILLGLGVVFHLLVAGNAFGQGGDVTFDLSKYKYCSDMQWDSPALEAEERLSLLGCVLVASNSEMMRRMREISTAMEIPWEKFTLYTTEHLQKCISFEDELHRNIIVNEAYVNSLAISSVEKEVILTFSIAHEVAHHLNGDFRGGYGSGLEWQNQMAELKADLWAGRAIGKVLNVSQDEIQSALNIYFKVKHDDFYHPAFEERILWVLGGWLLGVSANWEPGTKHWLGGTSYSKEKNLGTSNTPSPEYVGPLDQPGFGIKVWRNATPTYGEIHVGNFKDRQLHGVGSKLVSSSTTTGIVREFGSFQNGYLSGYGESYYGGGTRYFGNYLHGNRVGLGMLIWDTGEVYFGEFKNDRASGPGIRFYPKEGMELGEFESWDLIKGSTDRITRRKM